MGVINVQNSFDTSFYGVWLGKSSRSERVKREYIVAYSGIGLSLLDAAVSRQEDFLKNLFANF